MAELNLKQIIDKLNEEFTGETRKLVFWYDDKGEFVEDMESVVLDNAKVYYLEKDNQFFTKHFLECEDKDTNYLLYAPFPKPEVRDNHLEDILLYSKRFYADRASLLSVDLGIEDRYKPIIEKHIKFFANKERTQRFYDLEIENFNTENILVGLLSAICRTRTCSFEEVVRVIMTEGEFVDNKYLEEIEKYNLIQDFWRLCEQYFGYMDSKPSLEKLVVTMFITYTDKYIKGDVPKAWRTFIAYKSGSVIAFLDNLMNSVLYREQYDELSSYVAKGLKLESVLASYQPEDVLYCDTFKEMDSKIIGWIIDRLLLEDIGAKLDGLTIVDICDKRKKMHFGSVYVEIYDALESAYKIIQVARYSPSDGMKNIMQRYVDEDYVIDAEYRKFYLSYDSIDDTEKYETIRDLVENIYTNEYLAKIISKWNEGITSVDTLPDIVLQKDFYRKYIKLVNERTVVIISDAMRYEVGQELFKKMQDNSKCTAKIDTMLGVLPSYTRLGMAALLPNDSLTITDDYKVLVDGKPCDNLASRESILKSHCIDSVCVQFDDIKSLKRAELRSIFTGKQVIYVYHNQIDARGDKANTEDEVFVACEEAIEEIMELIKKIATSANTYRFLVTADHGFIYKRDKISESDKIDNMIGGSVFSNRRFIMSDKEIVNEGVVNLKMSDILNNDDNKIVSVPLSSNVFKVSGGGQNYVHGGSSPQELIIPVVDIKMERGHVETKNAEITLVSMVQKITNLITSMDFIQSEPVNDTVKETSYKIFFISEDGEKISNENIYVADSRDVEPQKRMFRMRFTFKNKKYDKNKAYYLVVLDESTELELFRHAVVMDLAFGDDFGFGF